MAAARGMALDHRHLPGALQQRSLQAAQADRAGADHHDPSRRLDTRLAQRVDAVGQRLHQRAQARVHARGQLEQAALGHRSEFGEAARRADPDQMPVQTEIPVSRLAVGAPATTYDRVDRHPTPEPGGIGARAGRCHQAGVLMAHDERRDAQGVVAEIAAKLRAADTGVGDLDEDLASGGLGTGLVAESHRAGCFPD